jgi:hypothetical protein
MIYYTENVSHDQLDARMADLSSQGWTLHSVVLMPSQRDGDNPVFVTIWQK